MILYDPYEATGFQMWCLRSIHKVDVATVVDRERCPNLILNVTRSLARVRKRIAPIPLNTNQGFLNSSNTIRASRRASADRMLD